MSALARKVDVHTSTISAMVHGRRDTDPGTVASVAAALKQDTLTVFEWVGLARSEKQPFVPHPDADLLDQEGRDAVNELIRVLARPAKQRTQPDYIFNTKGGGQIIVELKTSGPRTAVDEALGQVRNYMAHLNATQVADNVVELPERPTLRKVSRKPGRPPTNAPEGED